MLHGSSPPDHENSPGFSRYSDGRSDWIQPIGSRGHPKTCLGEAHLTKVIGRFALKVDRSFFSANGSFRTTGNLGSTKVFQRDTMPTTIMRKTV